MVKVSIIIPIYNTEQYLRQCLDSVIAQTLNEIEIICVDDGSTDKCPQIIDEYAEKDSRIKVIHKENGGLVSARKAGVEEATGLYTGYVDSDDWIEADMYEKLYTAAMKYHADIVASGYILEGNYTTFHFDTVQAGLYQNDNLLYLREHTIYCHEKKEVGLRATLCSKLFLTDQLRRIQKRIPEEITMSEDKVCLLEFILECSSVYVMKEAYYHYRINGESMVHKPNYNYLVCVNHVYQYLLSLFQHPNFTQSMRVQAELYITEMLMHGINQRMGFENRNLFWIDPYWLESIPEASKVILYGGGELGEKYYRHLSSRKDLKYAGCVDYGYERFADSNLKVCSPTILWEIEYDYIVITIKNPGKAEEVREQLIQDGIEEKKILWFEQKDIFWKYAEADGLLNP